MITNLKTNRRFSGYVPVEEHPLLQVAFATANSAFRKSALEDLKGFDVSFETGEDMDLSIRLARSGWKLYFKPSAVVRHKHRRTLEQLLKQWFKYGLHHPYLFKKHHPRRLEVFVYKRRGKDGEPWGVKHLFGAPFPFHAALHLSDFYYMHALLWLFAASMFPFGPNPLSGLALTGACYFGARHSLADFDLWDPKKSATYALLRYLLNVTYIAGGFVGGIKNNVFFLDLPREQSPGLGRTSIVCSDMGPGDARESRWSRQLAKTDGLELRGICYDVGTRYGLSPGALLQSFGRTPRSTREMDGDFKTIKEALNCNAVRIFGDRERSLVSSASLALKRGMTVFISPRFIDARPEQAARATGRLARALEDLREKWGPGKVILLVANEAMLDLRGIVEGVGVEDRRGRTLATKFRLNKALKELVVAARLNFHGLISYSALPSDAVNWRMFDLKCLNLYLNERNLADYPKMLLKLCSGSKPAFITEFGFTTNHKALELGEHGYKTVDWKARKVVAGVRRDEDLQAKLMAENLEAIKNTNLKGAFPFCFAEWRKLHRSRQSLDFDLGSFGVMKVASDGRVVPKPAAKVLGDFYGDLESQKKVGP